MKLPNFIAVFGLLYAPAIANGARIVLSNDDGWATKQIRMVYEKLSETHDVVLSAPADNRSGKASQRKTPTWRYKPCHFDTCPADSPPWGHDENSTRLNWVNSYGVTAMKWGMETFGPSHWNNTEADIAVSGPNMGNNYVLGTHSSSTAASAAWAAKHGMPGIAFSGQSRDVKPYWEEPTQESIVYTELASMLVDEVLKSGKPYLPHDTFLNVNFPRLREECQTADQFRFVLTRAFDWFSGYGEPWCRESSIPPEGLVLDVIGSWHTMPCTATVTIGNAHGKMTMKNPERQAIVMEKLKHLVECPIGEWYTGLGNLFKLDEWKEHVGVRRYASDPAFHDPEDVYDGPREEFWIEEEDQGV